MNDRSFDDLTRMMASPGNHRSSRRSLLRSLLAGGTAAGLTGVVTGGMTTTTTAQEETPATRPTIRPPGGPSVAQKAFDLLYDPEAIFAFVAREVIYDPYPGALRGAKGTLWGLSGNSVDQALLLAGLLNESLVRTRFVIGTLDDEVAANLLASAAMSVTEAAEYAGAVNALLTPEQGAPPPASLSAEMERFLEKLPEESTRLVELGSAELERGVALIEGALATASISVPSSDFSLPDRERAQHVWVQYAAGPEWIDLDPSVPGAEMGQVYGTVLETVDELPDDLFHTVSFRVYAEQVQGGVGMVVDLLTHQAHSVDLVGEPLTFMHAKPESLQALGESILGSIEGTMQYVPHLVLGAEDAVAAMERITFNTGGGLLDVLGGSGSNDGDTVAEWLEVMIASPDAEPRTVTRTIFDRLSPEARESGDADLEQLPPVELTDVEGSQVFLPAEAVWSIVTATGPIPFSYFQQDRSIDDLEADFAGIGFAYHNARDGLALRIAADYGHRFYLDRPNLTAFSITPLEITERAARANLEIDLLYQSIASAPFVDREAELNGGVIAGVLSHVTERLILAQEPGELGQVPVRMTSVGRVFEEAERNGVPIRTLLPATGSAASLDISSRARTGVETALQAGFVVIVPERAVELDGEQLSGWWQIDPTTGLTFDLMETGHGASGVDYVLMLKTILRNAIYYGRLGFCARSIYFMVATLGLLMGYVAAVGAPGPGGYSNSVLVGGAVVGGAAAGTAGATILACG